MQATLRKAKPNSAAEMPHINKHDLQVHQNMNLFFFLSPEVSGAFTIKRSYFILFIHYLFIESISPTRMHVL